MLDFQPGIRQIRGSPGGGIETKLDLTETPAQGSHLLGEEEITLLQISDVAGETLDFRQVVRGEKEGCFSYAVKQALN